MTGERFFVVAVRGFPAAGFYVHDRAFCGRTVAVYESRGRTKERACLLAEQHAARLNANEAASLSIYGSELAITVNPAGSPDVKLDMPKQRRTTA